MTDKIPASAKAYMKQVRANKQKQKQRQSSKQSQVVIINQPSKRRARQSSPKSAPAVIPYVIPQQQLTQASYQNTALAQPDTLQQLTQALSQFQSTPTYRNPFRTQPAIINLNPPPQSELPTAEIPLDVSPPPPPNPVMPDIVQEPNRFEQLASPPIAVPINPSAPIYQGFVENQARNDLDRQTNMELEATEDYGGYDAYTSREIAESIPMEAKQIQKEQDLILSLRSNSLKAATKHFRNLARIENIPENSRSISDVVEFKDAKTYLANNKFNPAIMAVLQKERLEYINSGK